MSSLENICNNLHGLKPTLIMVMVQTVLAIVTIGYKLSANDGMSLPILVGYRFMFGAAFIVPVAFFAERKKRPKLTRKTALYGFLCGLFGGSLGQNLYLKSMSLTSTIFVSAMMNLIPAITFIVAICLRLEKLGWNTAAGKAKVFGTTVGISGAMLLSFYKGPTLNIWNTHINLLESTSTHHHMMAQAHEGGKNNLAGAALSLASCTCYSLWLIIQAKASEQYPCPYSITAMMTTWASIQSVGFALCTERDWSQWILGWNIRLLTVLFAGIIGSGSMFTLVAWCVRMRGPLFVSIFNPLMLVVVSIAASLFLQEKLHLGMVIGAILIVGGLYVVLWGISKERKKVSQLMPENNDEEMQGQIDDIVPQPSQNGSSHSKNGSSHHSRKELDADSEEEKRDSEVIGGLYIYP